MGIRHSSWRGAFARGMAALMVVIAVVNVRWAIGAPGDIFSSPAPIIGADPQKATDIKAGDASVSTQTGAAGYSYPIQVPPGRGGMAPHLALSYSSQAPIYGNIASGWTLGLPEIRENTSQGRLRTHSPEVESAQADPRADDRFVSSMAGGRPLVAVTEPTSSGVYKTYRSQNDTSFMRYERMNPTVPVTYRWRVYATDGSVMYFGERGRTDSCPNVSEGYAPLTRVVDAFGNEATYEYESAIIGECRIKKISWGQNAAAGLSNPFAQVVFNWNGAPRCGNIEVGSRRDYRTVFGGLIVTGASKLVSIIATAFPPGSPGTPDHTRVISLGYDAVEEGCSLSHSPVRLLKSIQESAWGTDSPRVDLPAVSFDYGPPNVSLTVEASMVLPAPWGVVTGLLLDPHRKNLAWGYRHNDDRWPSVEAMMVDIDGDGLIDRLTNTSVNSQGQIGGCSANWQKNLGVDSATGRVLFSSAAHPIALPRLKWRGTTNVAAGEPFADRRPSSQGGFQEGCALNGQVTAFENSTLAFNCHSFSSPNSCTSGPDPSNPGPFCYPGGTECPAGAGGKGTSENAFRTYLAYRWLDADGDGLTDLVAAVHGDIDSYDIVQGNLVKNDPEPELPAPEPELFGTWPACPGQVDRCKDMGRCLADARKCTGPLCTMIWDQVNTCLVSTSTVGCSRILARPSGGGQPQESTTRGPYMRCEGLYPWFIYKNQGNGVFRTTPMIKYQPVPLESDQGDSALTGPGVAAENHAVIDLDGDGILDAIAHGKQDPAENPDAWYLWLGDGTGGFETKRYFFPTRNHDGSADAPGNPISGQGLTWGTPGKSSAGLFDLNGDGLPDHWLAVDNQLNANITFNDGVQFRVVAQTPASSAGELTTPYLNGSYAVRPGNDTDYFITDPLPQPNVNPTVAGFTGSNNRTVDIDGDGRIDVATWSNGNPLVFFNLGGQFNAPGFVFGQGNPTLDIGLLEGLAQRVPRTRSTRLIRCCGS